MTSTSASNPATLTLNVKVITQLPEPNAHLYFPSLPPETTIAELKSRIRDAIHTSPAPDRQRLIHKGRVAARESDKLLDVFGRLSAEQFVFHLVIRDGNNPTSGVRHDSSANNLPPPQPSALFNLPPPQNNGSGAASPFFPGPTLPGSMTTGASSGVAQPRAPPTTSDQAIQNHMHQHQMLHFQQIQQMQQVHHQNLMQAMQQGQNYSERDPSLQPINQTNVPLQPMRVQGNALDHPGINQNMDRRNAQAEQPVASQENQNQNQGQQGPMHDGQQYQHNHGHVPPGVPNNFTREAVGPNGQRVTMTVNSMSNVPMMLPPPMFNAMPPYIPSIQQHPFPPQLPGQNFVPPGFPPHQPGPGFMRVPSPSNPARMAHTLPSWPGRPVLGSTGQWYGTAHAIDSMRHFESNLTALQARLTEHLSLSREPRAQLASSFYAAFMNILRPRNNAQRLVNNAIDAFLAPGRPHFDEVLYGENGAIQTLQDLNSSFQRLSREMQQGIDRLRRGSPNQPGRAEQGADESATLGNHSSSSLGSSGVSTGSPVHPVKAYLLLSPTGPHAVVLSPSGIFLDSTPSSASQHPGARSVEASQGSSARPTGSNPSLNAHLDVQVQRAMVAVENINREIANANDAINQAQTAVNALNGNNDGGNGMTAAGSGVGQGMQHDQGQNQANAVLRPTPHQEAQAQEDAGDLLRLMSTIFRHLWLLIKIFGFIWFLTRGGTSRRTIILCAASLIYVILQAEFFAGYRDRFRRHFEGLLGPPAQDQQPQRQDGVPPNEAAGEDGTRRAAQQGGRGLHLRPGEPVSPQATASRLIDQRREQERSWWRDQFRGIERVLALFLASLYPGVGERHVAARERAARTAQEEEVRQAREREAEEQRRSTQTDVANTGEQASVSDLANANSNSGENSGAKSPPRNSELRADAVDQGTSTSVEPSTAANELRDRGTAQAEG